MQLCESEQKLNEMHEAVKQMYTLEASPAKTIQSSEDGRVIAILKSTCTYILVKENDSQAQRCLWWNDTNTDEPSVYKMNALSFGLNCVPCISHFVRNKTAKRFEDKYPRAVKAIIEHHDVDGLVDSVDDEEDAIQLKMMHSSGGFSIRYWASNSPICVSEDDTLHSRELGPTEKVMGVRWDPVSDVFNFVYMFTSLQQHFV
ncbi:hypothetical protein EVAR_70645_1 [Eumeta japonica]|uniref:Uncharacterized protein n=1 Tax=Eumeta variegata TaxID=151549 RepID=A0A4C1T2Y1_EUMVA|nr:hypothetical protein EVAR_70645_1 [Eumeta japonica]